MEDLPGNEYDQPVIPTRPTLLTILCVLSFIGGAMGSTSFLMIYTSYNEVIPELKDIASNLPGVELIAQAPKNFFLTGFFLYLFSFIGVNLMWRLRKVGFHFYTAAQAGILLSPLVYIKGFPFPWLDGMITAAFVMLYARHLKLFT